MSTPRTVAADIGPAMRRPRRWMRHLIATVVSLILLLGAVAGGIAWYFSGVALAVDHGEVLPHQVLEQVPGTTGSGTGPGSGTVALRLDRDAETVQPGTSGLVWKGGQGRIGPVLSGDATSVTRRFTPAVGGVPAPRTRVRVDASTWFGNPSSALGMAYSEVRVPGPLGPLPSWFISAGSAPSGASAGRTWIVFVHGHNSDLQESLRYVRGWHDLGYPVLVASYRNDVGAPSSPDRRHHLGDTEWQDVAAAVRWAHARGAADVVLAGWSMGGAIALQAADRSDVAPLVRGLVLDSPVIDWRDVFDVQGAERGLPRVEIALAEQFLQWRSGIDLDRLDWVARAGRLRVPTIILDGDSDDYVPEGPAIRLAEARPDLVTLVRFPGARHTMAWNVDPGRYDTAVRDWLSRLPI